jgi:hypothetical protein
MPENITLLEDGRPNWEAIKLDVQCGRCGYDLRLLPEPRCPECGLQFEWADVLDEARLRSEFLFEHHWVQRPIGSWLATVRRSMRPKRFWQTLSLHHRVHVGPLCVMLLSAPIAFHLLVHAGILLAWAVARSVALVQSQLQPRIWPTRAAEVADDLWHFADPTTDWVGMLTFSGLVLTIHLAAFATLCLLHQTLSRCRVRRAQVLRVVAYAALPTTFCWLAIFLTTLVTAVMYWTLAEQLPWEFLLLALALVLWMMCLRAGLKHYLRIPRPGLVAASAVIVAFLFTWVVLAHLPW